jgi:hypothetical protein
MKKLFAILTVAAVLTACNNSQENETTVTDSLDTESPLMDAMNTADSVNKEIKTLKDSIPAAPEENK